MNHNIKKNVEGQTNDRDTPQRNEDATRDEENKRRNGDMRVLKESHHYKIIVECKLHHFPPLVA